MRAVRLKRQYLVYVMFSLIISTFSIASPTMAQPSLMNPKGDINMDNQITLQDAVLSLQLLSGMDSQEVRDDYSSSGVDVNDDAKIGLAETLYILQALSDMRSLGYQIGSDGGIIEVTDLSNPLGGLRIEIPPNALPGGVTIDAKPCEQTLPLPKGFSVEGTIISLAPDGLPFIEPIAITLPYEGSEIPVVVSYNEAQDSYEVLPFARIDEQDRKITVLTMHFCWIAKVKQFMTGEDITIDGFSVAEDAFSINNTRSSLMNGGCEEACWGMSRYSQWYWKNKRATDGPIREKYPCNEERVACDAQQNVVNHFTMIWQAIEVGSQLLLDDASTYRAIRAALLLTGEPQLLGLRYYDWEHRVGYGHAVLVYGTRNIGGTYRELMVYENVDNSKKYPDVKIVFSGARFEDYERPDSTHEKPEIYTWFVYLGHSKSSMNDVYQKYEEPPTVPNALQAAAISPKQINLSWGASSDNVSVAGYQVYRNDQFLDFVVTTSFSDTHCDPGTLYCYKVRAIDNEYVCSCFTQCICETTPADTEPIAEIISPSGDVEIFESELVDFQGSVSGGNPPFTYLWDFGGGAPNLAVEDPGNVTFNTEGTYTVTFTVTDDDGDSSSETLNVTVNLLSTEPLLSVVPAYLNFDTSITLMTFEVTNKGGSTLNWTISEYETWLVCQSSGGNTSGDGEYSGTGNETVNVIVDRKGVTEGEHEGNVFINSNGGYASVHVRLVVAGETSYPDTVMATVPVGNQPCEVAVAPDGEHVYVTNFWDGTVSVIRTLDNAVVDTVAVGWQPNGIALTPDGAKLYVGNYGEDTLSVIRTSDNAVVETFGVGNGPCGVSITPDGAYAYVTNYFGGTVSVIGCSDNTVLDSILVSLDSELRDIAITPEGNYAYATAYGKAAVTVIRTSDNAVVETVSVGYNPWGVTIAPDGSFVYVSDYYKPTDSNSSVSIISRPENGVEGAIFVGDGPRGICVRPNGQHVYVANYADDTVSVIRTSDNTVIDTISVGDQPQGVAVAPDGNYVYVANRNSASVTVIGISGN